MAEDRSTQMLNLDSKAGTKVSSGVAGANSVFLTGVAAGTAVAAGDYQVSYTDGKTESAKVDVPAFTVPAAATEPAADTGSGTTETTGTTDTTGK